MNYILMERIDSFTFPIGGGEEESIVNTFFFSNIKKGDD